ncbi:hypothetical protein Dda_5419 [Drechslerella dactyloides]|uniref:Uncharacterized protein n=1 Tax=Drechslerella dactyloides TaxID=74499 RepID=A0AAD6NK76_DREDA|nr:hypothetical protein Dda_5419 [Drechslerella dactyloides]
MSSIRMEQRGGRFFLIKSKSPSDGAPPPSAPPSTAASMEPPSQAGDSAITASSGMPDMETTSKVPSKDSKSISSASSNETGRPKSPLVRRRAAINPSKGKVKVISKQEPLAGPSNRESPSGVEQEEMAPAVNATESQPQSLSLPPYRKSESELVQIVVRQLPKKPKGHRRTREPGALDNQAQKPLKLRKSHNNQAQTPPQFPKLHNNRVKTPPQLSESHEREVQNPLQLSKPHNRKAQNLLKFNERLDNQAQNLLQFQKPPDSRVQNPLQSQKPHNNRTQSLLQLDEPHDKEVQNPLQRLNKQAQSPLQVSEPHGNQAQTPLQLSEHDKQAQEPLQFSEPHDSQVQGPLQPNRPDDSQPQELEPPLNSTPPQENRDANAPLPLDEEGYECDIEMTDDNPPQLRLPPVVEVPSYEGTPSSATATGAAPTAISEPATTLVLPNEEELFASRLLLGFRYSNLPQPERTVFVDDMLQDWADDMQDRLPDYVLPRRVEQHLEEHRLRKAQAPAPAVEPKGPTGA